MSTGSSPHPDSAPASGAAHPETPSGEPGGGAPAAGSGSPQPGGMPQYPQGAGGFGGPPQGRPGPMPPRAGGPYPPQPYGPPPVPRAPRVPMRVPSLVGAALAVLSAALLVVGSFLTMWMFTLSERGTQVGDLVVTGWSRRTDPPRSGDSLTQFQNTHSPIYGIPLAVVAAALIAGAVLTFLSARRDAAPGRVAAARTVLLMASAATVAAVLTVVTEVEATLSLNGTNTTAAPAVRVSYVTGIGFWLLVGGAVVAIAAAVVALLKQDGGAGDHSADKTPPQGFPAPMPYGRQPQTPGWRPMQQPGAQQPGPQQPGAQPGQQPGTPQQVSHDPAGPPTGPSPSPVVPSAPSSGPVREHPLEADAPTQWRPMTPPEKPTAADQPADQPWEPPSSEEFTSRLEPDKPDPGTRD